MSKSLGNYFTVRDLAAQGFTGREIRFALLQAHYRESFNFTMDGLRGGRVSLARLDECLGKLREVAGNFAASANPALIAQFTAAMDNDLNVSAAWGAVFEWVRECNRLTGADQMTPAQAAAGLASWEAINSVLGIAPPAEAAVPAELEALLEQRNAARKARDFKRADSIRDELKAAGWAIEDTAKGARLKRL
jgi:cysteinyl-tRNA synthetase